MPSTTIGAAPSRRPSPISVPRRSIGIVCALAAMLSLSGCPAAKLYHEGREYDEAGKEYLAAQSYLAALGKNDHHKKAREALVAVAQHAYEEKLGLAEAAEKTENFPKALTEYRALDTLLDKLQKYDAVTFETVNVRQKIDDMENASAEQQYREGEKQLAAHAWEDAIRFYRGAQQFKANYKNTRDQIASAYYAWAEDDLKGSRYRDAAEHFSASTESAGPGYRDAAVRSGTIFASLGKYFLGADRCRQAVKDLRKASTLLDHGAVDADVAAAEECAVTPVAILAFENPTGTNLAGMALGDTLADEIGGKVKSGASEFVHLMERSALDAVLSEQGLSASGLAAGTTTKLRGVRYLVIGKLTQVKLDPPVFAKEGKAVTGTQPYDCTKTRKDGSSYQGTCFNEVSVHYDEKSGHIGVRIAGSVRVVDVKTGEQLTTLPLEAAFEDRVHFADSFTVNGNGVASLTLREHTDGIGVEGDVLRLATKERKELKTEDALTHAALEKLSADSAKAILASVDVERPANDPPTLALATSK